MFVCSFRGVWEWREGVHLDIPSSARFVFASFKVVVRLDLDWSDCSNG